MHGKLSGVTTRTRECSSYDGHNEGLPQELYAAVHVETRCRVFHRNILDGCHKLDTFSQSLSHFRQINYSSKNECVFAGKVPKKDKCTY